MGRGQMKEARRAFNRIQEEAMNEANSEAINNLDGINISISDKPCSQCQPTDVTSCDHCQRYEEWINN